MVASAAAAPTPRRSRATDKDCNGKVHTCKNKATSCVEGVCTSGAGGELCTVSPAASAKFAHCGRGSAAERFVGRCESPDFGVFAGCDEGKPKAETKYTTVFGPDDDDSPCVDIYTNQVVVYEGQYLAFPGACEFIVRVSTVNLVRL